MKQTLGIGVILAVAVAAVRVVGGPSAAGPVSGAPATVSQRTPHNTHPKPAPAGTFQGGCTVFDAEDPKADKDPKTAYPKDANRGAARAVIDRFFALDDPGSTLKDRPGVRYASALAPDPRHTNLSLVFDRTMVAIQQAAQDDGYTYNSSWFPWSTESLVYSSVQDQQRSEDQTDQREACPGVILFRKSAADIKADGSGARPPDPYAQALVVLVVGEQPTGGLNEDQWSNAIAWLNRNASTSETVASPSDRPRELSILGPYSSGTLVSLERDLAAAPIMQADGAIFPSAATPIRILSGSIRGCSSIRWFRKSIEPRNATFGSFQENDELQIYRLLNFLNQQGTAVSEVAILSEDETAYANTYTRDDGYDPPSFASCSFPYADSSRPVRLSYPRDISALRMAYEKQSVFATGSSSGAHPILRDDAEFEGDPSTVSDTIPNFGGRITPVAQEAILYGVVSNLRSHHSRYLLLRCTNPLDFLFLTRFFHRAYPEGRIVTVGSDLFFRREIDTTEFRGVLSLSSYPLLPRNQHWTHVSQRSEDARPLPHTHRTPDSHDEGIYLAARYLFDNAKSWSNPPAKDNAAGLQPPLLLPFKENLSDFADPFWMHDPSGPLETIQAPTWLSVVGRDGYWPVAVLNQDTTPDLCLDQETPHRDGTPCPPQSSRALPPPATMVQMDGRSSGGQVTHYDREPGHLDRFNKSLLFRLPLPWGVCALCVTFLLLYQVFGVWHGYRFTASGLFALFRTVATPSQAILLGSNCALAISLLLELVSIGLTLPRFSAIFESTWQLSFYTLVCIAATVVVLVQLIRARQERHPVAAIVFVAAMGVLFVACTPAFQTHLNRARNLPLFYRMGYLTAGVSPLVPVLFLLLGFYLWTWQALAGNALLCCGRPLLPEAKKPAKIRSGFTLKYWTAHWYYTLLDLHPAADSVQAFGRLGESYYRISHELGKRIVKLASPLCFDPSIIVVPAGLLIAAATYLRVLGPPLVGLEGRHFAWAVNLALLVAFLLTIAEAARLFFTWKELQRLLTALSRLRLRRTLARLRAVDSNSLWSVSGSVQRVQYSFFSQQLDAARRLANLPGGNIGAVQIAIVCGKLFAKNSADKISSGPIWEKPVLLKCLPPTPPLYIREVLNDAVAEVLHKVLLPHWATEDNSLSLETSSVKPAEGDNERIVFDMDLSTDPTVRAAEEFVCFHYIAFIQNILARMRTMILSMIALFISVCFSISFYPFVPRTGITIWMLINLSLIAASVIYVYAGMERDETLSYITNTRPGRLSGEFYLKTAAFLAGPVIGLLTAQFPAISESVLSWLQPGLDALK